MTRGRRAWGARGAAWLLCPAFAWAAAAGGNDPAARFRGPLAYDFGVTNVKWEAATPEYSYVTFDLHWSHSWRAKWTEPAETSCNGKPIEVENWDAAWVFVKFLPEKDSWTAKERNHWLHATLDKDPASHVMPAGATNTVKWSDAPAQGGAGGARGLGVFIYRDAVGHGVNDWKGIKLRWIHPSSSPEASGGAPWTAPGAAPFDPAKAGVQVYAIPMVYVPAGPYMIGAPAETGFSPFADGPDIPKTRYDGEQDFKEIPEALRRAIETTTSKDGGPYLRWTMNNQTFQFTDGGWRGGRAIPFLVDEEWNEPSAEGTRGRRIAPVAGCFWSTHTFSERAGGATFGGPIGGPTVLNDDCPTGYEAFYCMKYDLTQGQYCDYLNSLPPDVAAGRAWVSSEVWAAYNQRTTMVKDKLPSGGEHDVAEVAGNTIRSSADRPAGAGPQRAVKPEGGAAGGNDPFDRLIQDTLTENGQEAVAHGGGHRGAGAAPVYWARLPFRRLQGFCWDDIRAFCVWAGLRPMTGMEAVKASVGVRHPAAPWGPASTYDMGGPLEMEDDGLPTERPVKGFSRYGADYGIRVGCFSTPTSDRASAFATYWGVTELGGLTVPIQDTSFRGSHGSGTVPAGRPGASWNREFVAFTNTPPDWGRWDEYSGRRHAVKICRAVVSAGNRILQPAAQQTARVVKRKRAAQFPPAEARRDDIPRVANVRLEPGKDASTVSFDLSWKNSWRAKWQEPAEKNVTGKPLTVESWDAAWVIVKFRPAGARDEVPAMLAAGRKDHQVPAGAALEVGRTDEGSYSAGVFIYRSAVGTGANDFRNIRLRWVHPAGAAGGATVDPAKGEVKVYAIAMVYIPEGPFASRSPWGHPLKVITTPDATQPGGYLDAGTNAVPRFPEWPNGYSPFYCMKYSISQGQYADMLNSAPSGNFKVARRLGFLGGGNARLWSPAYYGFNGYTINTNAGGVFTADVPDRMCPLLTEADITHFIVWAGLRLMTNLEYEKACRGPRAVASGKDAWTPGTCGPASGLDKAVLEAPSAVGPGPSYWGLRELSLSGCVQEWPSVVASVWGWCRDYKGSHGTGAMEDPDDWPWGWFENMFYGGIWRCPGYGAVGHWINADEYGNVPYDLMDGERCGRYGVRAVRTAPSSGEGSPLVLDDLPVLSGADVAVFNISGSFRNESDQPLRVELKVPLPAACFPQGDASRAWTAGPKAATAFKVPVMLTRAVAEAAVERGAYLPVQVLGPGGAVLAKSLPPMRMAGAAGRRAPVIRSLEGGKVEVRLRNAGETPVTLVLAMPSTPLVKIAEPERSVTVAAGADAVAAFALPRQALAKEGPCAMAYRASLEGVAAALSGTVEADLRTQTRWWVTKRVKSGPKVDSMDALDGATDEIDGLEELADGESAVFKAPAPPSGWRRMTWGADLELGADDTVATHDSTVTAATRVESPSEREAVLNLSRARDAAARFRIRAWVNDALVYDQMPPVLKTEPPPNPNAKPFRLLKGVNTLAVECLSREDQPATPGPVSVEFRQPKGGQRQTDLILDMEPGGGR